MDDCIESAVERAVQPAIHRDVAILSAAFFFIFMGAGAQQQFLVPYLNNYLHFSNGTVVIATVYLTFLVFRVLSAYIMPRISDYAAIVIGAGTYVLFVLVALLFRDKALIVLAAVLWGAGAALFWVSSTVRVLDVTDQAGKYGRPSGMLYASTHAGFLLGVLLLGLVLDRRGYPGLFQTAAIMTLGGWIIILMVSRDGVGRDSPRLMDFVAIWRTRKAQVLGFHNALCSIGFGIMLGVFAEYTFATFGPMVLKVAVLYSLSRMLASSYGGVLSDRLGTDWVLLLGFVISAVGLVVPVLSESVAALGIAAFALGILAGAVPVAAMAIVGDSALAARRYLAMAALFVWRDLGVAVGLLGGEAMKNVMGGANPQAGFQAAFIAFALLFVICAALTPVLHRAAAQRL